MKTISSEKFRLRRVTVGAVMALMSTLLLSLPALAESLTCQVLIEARIAETSSLGSGLRDLGVQCPKAADTQGRPAYIQVNIDLTLDANVTNNRNFGAPIGNGGPLVVVGRQNITDALLIVNENTEGGAFATPNYLTGPSGVGQSPQYGMLMDSKTLRWSGVFLPVPGVSGNPDITTIRITNIQTNLARPGIPVGAKLAMRPPGYRLTQNGIEWDASTLAAVPMPLPNPPEGLGLLSAPVFTSLKLNSVPSAPSSDIGSAGVASQGTRLAISFTNIPQGSSVFVPPIVYLQRQFSPYASSIQSFDNATTGLPNTGVMVLQSSSPAYQIPYGNQNPYGSPPIYPYPYDIGRRTYGGQEDRGYNSPLTPVIPWEIAPWQIPGTIPWELRR